MIPETEKIHFKKGYKYQLVARSVSHTFVCPDEDIVTDYITLSRDGVLTIRAGYAWDGPSGPVLDTMAKYRGSLDHDALYQLARGGHLPKRFMRSVDKWFEMRLIQDGVAPWRARVYFWGLRKFGGPARSEKNKRKIFTAPKKRRAKK